MRAFPHREFGSEPSRRRAPKGQGNVPVRSEVGSLDQAESTPAALRSQSSVSASGSKALRLVLEPLPSHAGSAQRGSQCAFASLSARAIADCETPSPQALGAISEGTAGDAAAPCTVRHGRERARSHARSSSHLRYLVRNYFPMRPRDRRSRCLTCLAAMMPMYCLRVACAARAATSSS
jgi:hypothetical protein